MIFLSFIFLPSLYYFAIKKAMKIVKVLFNFMRMSVAMLNKFTLNVIAKMTGNVYFADPEVDLTEMESVRKQMMLDAVAAAGGDRQKVAALKETYNKLKALVKRQAEYVNFICQGDAEMILSSGYNTTRQPQSRKNPMFEATVGNMSGVVMLKHKSVKGARSYTWMYAQCEQLPKESEWRLVETTTACSCMVAGLTPGMRYFFRAMGILPKGKNTGWSDSIDKIVP
jgi:hypothetical protein